MAIILKELLEPDDIKTLKERFPRITETKEELRLPSAYDKQIYEFLDTGVKKDILEELRDYSASLTIRLSTFVLTEVTKVQNKTEYYQLLNTAMNLALMDPSVGQKVIKRVLAKRFKDEVISR